MPPKKSRRESQKVRMKKAATPDDLLNTEIKIVDEGESGIEMTAEERRKKKEEEKEKAKVEEKKKVEEEKKKVEEKKKIEETNAAAEESKKSGRRGEENGKETAVEAVIPASPVQQMTLPYMKRKGEEEVENTGIEAFSYFSSSTTSKMDSQSTATMDSTTTTFEESTNPTISAAILASTTSTTLMDSTTNTAKDATFEEPTNNLESKNVATFEEPSAASVVLEARAIVAAVIGEASFISSFDSSRSKSVEDDDDPLGEERNFSAVNREMSESEANDEESDGLELLEEIKEEIMREEKAEVESNQGASLSKKSSYQRPGTWTNITITSTLVQNTEEPLSPAEDKEFDEEEKLDKKMGNWKAPKAVVQGGGEVMVKEVAMADSPLVDAGTGRLVKEAGDMHLYSGIFSVMEEDKKVKTESKKENDEKRNGEILALLPHFLSFTSLTEAEVDSVRALVLHFPSGQLSLLKPFQLEDNNFAICLPGPALVALVSPLPALLIRAVLLPFAAQAPLLAPLAIALLPDSPATLLNLPNQLQGWKKVGYEQQCCIRRGETLAVKHQGQNRHGGDGGEGGDGKQGGDGGKSLRISLLTPPQNSCWVTWVGSANGDFLDASITVESTGLIVHTGPLPLYSSLKVEREAPHYLPPPHPQPVHPETLADRPSYGKTTNLEPLFAALRNGGLAEKSLGHLSSQLGADGEGVLDALTGWKEREGAGATLASFLHMLQKPEVNLLAVEKEIRQNEENSRCGIPALAIH